MYDVFISFKSSISGSTRKTEDYYLAMRLNDELKALGIKAYFSEEDLANQGTGDYKSSIIQAISVAKVFISVATKREYFESNWVKSEWDQYDNLRREGKKENDSMFVLGGSDLLANRPDELAGFQILDSVDGVVEFIKNRFIRKSKNDNAVDNNQSSYSYIKKKKD